ncbi:hypothetical protein PMAYCL1PPCAC_30519, partial [Pristionchus mayeri]
QELALSSLSMSESEEWGESWDDWDGSEDYSFGPNGEYVDMSTMNVGLWNSSEWFDREAALHNSSTPKPTKLATPPQPKDMVNEPHFVARIIRHYRYVAILDAVKSLLNTYFENPPAGYDSAYFLEEMKKWKEFNEIADKMKGDLRITSQTHGKESPIDWSNWTTTGNNESDIVISFLDGIQVEFGHMPVNEFEAMIKSHDEQVVRDMTSCIEHYQQFFKDLPSTLSSHFSLEYVFSAVKPDSSILMPYDKEAPRRFSRAGGLESGFGLEYRVRNDSRVRKHLEKIGVDLDAMGCGPYKGRPIQTPW